MIPLSLYIVPPLRPALFQTLRKSKRVSLFSMVWVPGYFVYYLLTTKGSLMERLRIGITPVIQPRAAAVIAMEKQRLAQAEDHVDLDVEMRLVDNPEQSFVQNAQTEQQELQPRPSKASSTQ